MPKISAPTVKDHRAMVKAKLIAAAERILREEGPEHLTAGAVASAAGIARNSIYRYVDSVDDLKLLVLEQYVPAWGREIFPDDPSIGPEKKMEAFLLLSLDHSSRSAHGWLMSLMRDAGAQKSSQRQRTEGNVENVHAMVDDFLIEQWQRLNVPRPRTWAAYTRMILFESFKEIERGVPVPSVKTLLVASLHGLIAAAQGMDKLPEGGMRPVLPA